jgi:hypothetical protein
MTEASSFFDVVIHLVQKGSSFPGADGRWNRAQSSPDLIQTIPYSLFYLQFDRERVKLGLSESLALAES